MVIDAARQLKRHVGVDVTSPRGAAPPPPPPHGAILAVRPNPPPPPPVASHAPPLAQLTIPGPQSHTQVKKKDRCRDRQILRKTKAETDR